jgi:hypothetical protein
MAIGRVPVELEMERRLRFSFAGIARRPRLRLEHDLDRAGGAGEQEWLACSMGAALHATHLAFSVKRCKHLFSNLDKPALFSDFFHC